MNKIGFLIVIIPHAFEFPPDIWGKTLDENLQMRTLKFDLQKPERILSNFLEANNINYVLLRPGFEEYSKETSKDFHFHYVYENYWNGNVHTLAAELIYKKLKESNIVSCKGRHV